MAKRKINRNMTPEAMDSRYTRQQEIINKVCEELGLVVFRPDYHADTTDNNTVIIYAKEGHAYNETLSNPSVDEEKGRVCALENTDVNNRFDLDYINCGTLDTRPRCFEDLLKVLIRRNLEALVMSKEKYNGLVTAGIKLCLFCSENGHKVCQDCKVTKLMADAKAKALKSGVIEKQ